MGSFHAGQTIAEFDEVVQTLKVGEISEPVKSMYGYHVIKLDDVQEERQLELDEVSAKIRASLEKAEYDKLYEAWMSELKEKFPLVNLE